MSYFFPVLSVDRELRVAHQQREEPPPRLFIFIPSPAVLPGRRCPRLHSPPLQQDHHLTQHFPSAQQSLLLPGSRQTERLLSSASSHRPPAVLCAAGEETAPLQGPVSSRVPGVSLPAPLTLPSQPSEVSSPPTCLRHCKPVLPLPLQLPSEPPARSHFPAPQTSRRHYRLSAAPASLAPDHQPLPLTAGPHLRAPAH